MKRFLSTLMLFVLAVGTYAQPVVDNILSPSRLPYFKDCKMIQIASTDTSGGNSDFISIQDGATATLADIKGPGIIVHMWVTIFSKDPYFLRRIVLRMYWDGEQTPSVEAPIGDFFGTGFQYKQYVTPYLGMSSGGYYTYFPMPFNKSARIEVVNQTGMEVNSFYYHIDYQQLNQPLDSSAAYFHASWRREQRTEQGKPYLILDAEGEGHYVGTSMSMQSYNNDMQYLEGDEMVYVDGEKKPSVYGTGTEDYFNSGWYFNRGEFAAPYHGLMLKDDSLARIAAYRYHILDVIPFKKSIHFTIEHGDRNMEVADYSSTAYWYQKEPHKQLPALPSAGMRIPLRVIVPNGALEAESLKPVSGASIVEDMSAFGADWSGTKQLRLKSTKEEDRFVLSIPVPEENYDLVLYFTKGPEYGNVDIFQAGKKIGAIEGFNKLVIPGGKIILRDVKKEKNGIPIEFVVTGRNKDARGFDVGLDAFVLQPHRVFIPAWYMIGPFPNPRDAHLNRLGLDQVYPPEQEFDTTKSYAGVDNKPVRWILKKTPAKGRMDMYDYDPYELVVVYAHTFVYSPKAQEVLLLLGSDDGAKVFLNAKEIHRVLEVRVVEPDKDRVPLALEMGWNELTLKIENNFGGYNFYARILDPEKSLVLSPVKKK